MAFRALVPHSERARELYGDDWLNSGPVLLSALRGQVILLEFWDYCSAECLRTMPYLKEWQRRYEWLGLVIVGVHTPRFPFGKDPAAVKDAIDRLGLTFPVVLDNQELILQHYECRSLPEMIAIDRDGFLRFRNIGEGSYGAAEQALQAMFYDAGISGDLPLVMDPVRESDRAGAVCYRPTAELFAGYLRGSIGNVEGYAPESVIRYADPGLYLDGRFYAEGDWMIGRDFVRLDRSMGTGGQVIVHYHGLETEGVLAGDGSGRTEITVRQDEAFLVEENRGRDVRIDRQGRSCLLVDKPRLYQIVRNPEYGEHVLRLSAGEGGLLLYTLSFSTAVIPELVSDN